MINRGSPSLNISTNLEFFLKGLGGLVAYIVNISEATDADRKGRGLAGGS
jgi:hypothetical protein